VSGVRCQVSGVRCQVSGVRCQVSGVRCQVSGVRCQVPGVRCQVPGNERFCEARPAGSLMPRWIRSRCSAPGKEELLMKENEFRSGYVYENMGSMLRNFKNATCSGDVYENTGDVDKMSGEIHAIYTKMHPLHLNRQRLKGLLGRECTDSEVTRGEVTPLEPTTSWARCRAIKGRWHGRTAPIHRGPPVTGMAKMAMLRAAGAERSGDCGREALQNTMSLHYVSETKVVSCGESKPRKDICL
jgi:hypothetical protein